jgi:hypothetical protein
LSFNGHASPRLGCQLYGQLFVGRLRLQAAAWHEYLHQQHTYQAGDVTAQMPYEVPQRRRAVYCCLCHALPL